MSKYLALSIIVILTAITRLTGLAAYPSGFTPDEAAFGYNAYSLLKTGKDEWSTPFWRLPVVGLRSFGDYKLPLYSFLAVPSVKLLGLSELSTRLPNALLSILSVAVFFVLGSRLGGTKAGLFAAFLLFVSPWNFSLSRGAFEANLCIFFIPLGVALVMSKRYLSGAFILAIAMYSYHTPRLIIPLLCAFLAVFYIPIKKLWLPLLIFLLIAGAAFFSLVKYNARSADISIFNPADNWQAMSLARIGALNSGWPPWLARLAYNKITFTLPVFTGNFFSYFNPRFLFLSGAAEASYGMLPGTGVIYFIELPFLLGFLLLVIKKPRRAYFLILFLLLLAPIPASLTKGAGLAGNRTAPLLIPLILMSAVGAAKILSLAKKRQTLIIKGAGVLFIISFALFLNSYIKGIPLASAKAMGYGWPKFMPDLEKTKTYYSEIRFSRSLSEPHIYLAFYLKTDPLFYQFSSVDWLEFENQGYRFLDQYDGYRLGTFRFGNLDYDKPVSVPTLYVGRPDDFPKNVNYYISSYYPDLVPAIVLAEKNPPL